MIKSEFTHPGRTIATMDRRALLLGVTGGIVSLALAPILGTTAAQSNAATLETTMDLAMAAAIEAGIPGFALAIEHRGELIYSGAAGVSSIELGTPMKATDRFRIYSITKTFTATIIYQLVDEGILSLDDTVDMWLDTPEVQRIPNVERITIRQVLNHTSGIYDFGDDDDSPFWNDAFLGPEADWSKIWTLPELLAYADPSNHPPYFAPGEGIHYSNTGYILLGMIVEAAIGSTFGDALQTRILTPLELNDTALAVGGTIPEGVVDGYQLLDGQLLNVTAINLSWIWSAGGLVSSTADLLRFASATQNGELLSPASFAEMFTFVPSENPQMSDGSGLIRAETPDGTVVGMDGGSAGFGAQMMWMPDEEITVVTMVNWAPGDGSAEAVRDEAFAQVLKQ